MNPNPNPKPNADIPYHCQAENGEMVSAGGQAYVDQAKVMSYFQSIESRPSGPSYDIA